ncbi:zinc finger protein 808 [Microplitis demolitor]|uniref:zinc finger protein 808 n=1 Tax=Microplitis demolitor TaxID=69319 RepID=UPI00235B63E4|nr:zinc finger protein 808 [Microplitis demolitor]
MFIVTKQIDSENISKLCRTCLREDGKKMICLFVGPAETSLAAKLRSLSCLEVWQGDGLPEKLCDRCVTRAESALLFREQCRAADRALRQAAARVSGLTNYTTVSGCKLYQQNQGLTPIESSQKTLKCSDCGAVFINYQELQIHSRIHAPFIQESTSLSHMHIVESQNPYYNPDTSISPSIIANNHHESIVNLSRPSSLSTELSQKNERPACALHCSLCNHTFPNRNQLINHNLSHCANNEDTSCDDSIEIGDDSNPIAENLSFQAIDLAYPRHNPSIDFNYPENLNLSAANPTTNDLVRGGLEIQSSSSNLSDQIIPFPRFPDDLNGETLSNEKNLSSNDNLSVQNNSNHNELVNLPEKKHKCLTCNKSFSQKSKLKTHEFSHTGEKPFKCINCDKAYTSKSKLNAHIRLHTGSNIHQCDVCQKTFAYPSYLIEHLKIHNINSSSRVNISNEVTQTNNKINLNSQKFECSICGKKFSMKKNLRGHLKLHSGNGLFNCEICDKLFSQKYNLKVHMRVHKRIKVHKCEYCDKSFSEKGNYKEHLRIHTKVKPFVCKLCNKAFSQSSHLKNHEASHDNQRPYQCRLCGKRFKLSSHLKRHVSLHSSVKTFKCLQCDQMFTQAFSLKRHLKKHNEAI